MLARSLQWLGLLGLGGCLLADVGIDPALDDDQVASPTLQGGSGGAGGSNGTPPSGSGGGSGSANMPTAGGSGGGGSAGGPSVQPAQGGSTGSGTAGSESMMPNMGGAAGSGAAGTSGTLAAERCPDDVDLETACAQYCDAYTEACADFTPANGDAPYDYANSTDCAVFCFQQSGWAVGTNSTVDTVKCRCFHSVLALTQGVTPHCFHAARVPTLGGCQPTE